MATTLPWGEQVAATMSVGFLVNQFTLNDATFGALDGAGVLDGNLEGLDVTEYVMAASLRRGRSNELTQFEAGTLTLTLLNDDRRFDPINEDSPYWDATTGRSGVQPRRRVTLTLQNQQVFDGAITAIAVDYDADLSTCTITAADDFVVLANQTIETEVTPTVEASGTRIARVLDLPEVDFSLTARDIATGGNDLQALPITAGTAVLQYLQSCAQSDQALLFMSRSGVLTYSDPLPTVWNYEVAANFTDLQGTFSVDSVPYMAIATITDQTNLYNKVVVSKQGGSEVVSDDIDSQDAFGISTLSLQNLLLNDDTAVANLSTELLERFKDPVYRFDDIEFAPAGMTNTERSTLNALELGDGIEVQRTFSVGTPASVVAYYQVERLMHTITPNTHTVTVGLGSLKQVVYQMTLNDPDFGVLDANNAVT